MNHKSVNTGSDGPMRIDLRAVLRSKLGRKARWVPGFVTGGLERLICARELNRLLAVAYPRRGADFCEAVLSDLNVTVNSAGAENLPSGAERPLIVSNHPLGGVDGMALIAWARRHYGADVPVHFVVNDLLMAVEPLADVFVPVNKHGAQSRDEASRLEQVMAAEGVVLMFPAGLCSRLDDNGRVRDLEWQRMFVNRAVKYGRTVVPVHFDGSNSQFFYKFARLRKRLGLRFNFEMLLLPRQIMRTRNARFTVHCGRQVDASQLKGGAQAGTTAQMIRQRVYELASDDVK